MKIPFKKELANLKLPSLLPSMQRGGGRFLPSAKRDALQLPPTDTPFEGYERGKLIKLLNLAGFVPGRSVLEVGCGLGDLLIEAAKYQPKELYGVDGNAELVARAQQYVAGTGATVSMANVGQLPFPDKSFDVVLVMYELQHLPEKNLPRVIDEVTRVARQWVILVEQTAPKVVEKQALTLRPVEFYKEKFRDAGQSFRKNRPEFWAESRAEKFQQPRGSFHLRKYDQLHVNASRYIFTSESNPWHWLRWAFSPLLYLMGFPRSVMQPPVGQNKLPDSKLAMTMQRWSLPTTIWLDDIFRATGGTTVMWFERDQLFRRG